MFNKYNSEFNQIVDSIINNEEFQKMKDIPHHGITRYHHLLRVAYYTYYVTKFLRLDYLKATRAAVLHDFFFEQEGQEYSKARVWRKHPSYAIDNTERVFGLLSDKEKDIIKTHMFPVTFTPPKYLESWIVDIIDDIAGIYEKTYSIRIEFKTATSFLMLLFINYFH